MKLLVTGGCGFIGSNFIRYWNKNHPHDDIVNLDNLTYAGNPKNLIGLKQKFVKGDIRDRPTVERVMEDRDIVVHFAAETHVDRSLKAAELFHQVNVEGTEVLINTAMHNNIRFHHISTDEVFGEIQLEEKRKFNEQSPHNPRTPYAISKATAENLIIAKGWKGLQATISNCSNNYGPYQHPEKFIPRAITHALQGKPIPIYGDGLYVRDWLHVEDHCRALDLIIRKGKIGESYCIGGQLDEEISNIQVARQILEILGKDPSMINRVTDREIHDRKYVVDSTKVRTELGWQPHYDFNSGLRETVEWFVNNQEWWRPLKESAEKIYN